MNKMIYLILFIIIAQHCVVALDVENEILQTNSTQVINQILDEIYTIRFELNQLAPNVSHQYLQNSLTQLNQILTQNVTQNIDHLNSSTVENLLTQSVLATFNIIILKLDWNRYSRVELKETTTRILEIYDNYSLILNYKFKNENQDGFHVDSFSTIKLAAKTFRSGIDNHVEFQFEDIKLQVPLKSIVGEKQIISATAIVTYSLPKYLTFDHLEVNSPIVTIVIGNESSLVLDSLFRFRINTLNPVQPTDNPKCAFWNTTESSWSTSGCFYIRNESSTNISVCECDHLSNFIVVNDTDLPEVCTTTPTTTTLNPIDQVVEDIVQEIDGVLDQINSSPEISIENWFDSLRNISELVSSIIQEEILPQVNQSTALHVTNSSLTILDLLINPENIWNNLTTSTRFESSSTIFKITENLSILMNSKQNNSSITLKFENIVLQSKQFPIDSNQSINFDFDDISLDLPIQALNLSKNQISTSVVLLKTFPNYLSQNNLQVNSHAISVQVGADPGTILLNDSYKLRFVTKNLERLEFGDSPQCAFWDFEQTNFSTSGCAYNRLESNRSNTVCECNHLTDFLALTDISNREIPSTAKSVLTYICSSISSAFLIWSVYISLRYNREHYTIAEDQFNVKSNRFYLSLNISVWLLISHMLIMFGLDRTEVKIICDLNSIILLFSLLTTFSFMLMFSTHLYISTSRNHLFRSVAFKHFAMFAYALPVGVMLFAFIIIYATETNSFLGLIDSLAGEYFCWLSSVKYPYHIWIFVGPVTIIILVNSYILISIIYKLIRNRNQKPLTKRLYGNLFTAYILLFNFGIPWILYVFYINEKMAHVFSYIFIVINGTQGISLFAEQYYLYRMKQQRMLTKRNASDSSRATILSSISKSR